MLCDVHASEMPATPSGISNDAAGHFTLAVRATDGVHCEACRSEIGRSALQRVLAAPRASLPEHWLDRAIALSSDHTRSEAEKLDDAGLPASLTAAEVAREFLRRMEKQPRESVPIGPSSWLRPPDYVSGWTVNCRRTEYTAGGAGAQRYKLPCLISVDGELLGPMLEGDRQGAMWWVVPESDIELPRLVNGVAQILVLSAFTT
ncbi:MAG: hypothetical protein QOD83_3416 [Solirubrobacteraceae bacterium]|jgi:hypothetical protein|nr:hypothetical protein [Solirubrobacteraceae bacterium]MEA2188001.1 hypothetical protein [Solirubrobacteraceae bacterium]MEA2233600.1 hypothetical protein [Solirubrobacteraceae bacterium]